MNMVGLLNMMTQQQYVRGTRWFGDCSDAAVVVVALSYYPPVPLCTWHMI